MTYASFSATPAPGYWHNGIWWQYDAGAASAAATTFQYNWPPVPAPQTAAQVGWKCADCSQVMAPWVETHNCAASAGNTSSTPFLAKGDDLGEQDDPGAAGVPVA
jgi:hypothetical protein